MLLFLKSENSSQILRKEAFLVDFHGCNRTAVESMNLDTIGVWIHTHPTWALDSPVTRSVALRGVLRAHYAKIVSLFR